MKKKNVLTMALSVSLVGVIAVGGTLAYLTSTTGPVTNTFTGSAGITMTLDEAPVDANGKETAGARRTENSYSNILPGEVYDKDPTVHITSVPANGADVYVVVKGATGDDYTVTFGEWNSKLTKVEGYTDLYKYTDVVEPSDITGGKFDIKVFDTIEFNYDDADVALNNVTVKAYAVQTGLSTEDLADDYESVADMAAEALDATKVTPAQD